MVVRVTAVGIAEWLRFLLYLLCTVKHYLTVPTEQTDEVLATNIRIFLNYKKAVVSGGPIFPKPF